MKKAMEEENGYEEIMMEEFQKWLKSGKAPGIDGITEILKIMR